MRADMSPHERVGPLAIGLTSQATMTILSPLKVN
jgi:hypothetical protein